MRQTLCDGFSPSPKLNWQKSNSNEETNKQDAILLLS